MQEDVLRLVFATYIDISGSLEIFNNIVFRIFNTKKFGTDTSLSFSSCTSLGSLNCLFQFHPIFTLH